MGISAALSTTATTVIGNKLGKGDAFEAYKYFIAILMSLAVYLTFLSSIFYFYYENFINWLTSVKKL